MQVEASAVQVMIGRWKSLEDFASDAGVKYEAAKQMKRRSSISPTYWVAIVEGAKRRGIRDVTHEALAMAHAPSKSTEAA